jgi:hypothetical protein
MPDAGPYVVPSPEAISLGAWTMTSPQGEQALPEWLPYWDVSQALRVRRQLEIDLPRIRSEANLADDAPLRLSVVFASDFESDLWDTTLRDGSGKVPVDLDVALAGHLLGGTVSLVTSLVLAEPSAPSAGPVAWRRGSILWQDIKKVRLYGESSQFPLMDVDFAAAQLDPAAPWFVQLGSDLDLPAMGSICLLLNERFPLVLTAARDFAADRPELAAIRSMLYVSVGRVLVETALGHDDLEEDWPEDSLGAVLRAVVRSRFAPSIEELRILRDQDPAVWAAMLDGAFGLLREPLR